LSGCQYGFTLPSSEPAADGPVELGSSQLRERRTIIPGFTGTPYPLAPPEAGITSDQCSDLDNGGPTDGCITGTLECGQTVVGHTRGGVDRFDTYFYEKKFCTPATTYHDSGDERVYVLDVPEIPRGQGHTAIVTLDTPCADLDLAAFKWNEEGCPTNDHLISQCEMWPEDGTSREMVKLVTQHATRWLVVVEGKDDNEGAFSLTVQCTQGMR
jgi:hypothetical protein